MNNGHRLCNCIRALENCEPISNLRIYCFSCLNKIEEMGLEEFIKWERETEKEIE